MSAAKNGGSAFPSAGVTLLGNDGEPYQHGAVEGMSLRDYFAAHAPIEPAAAIDFFYRNEGRNPRMNEMIETLAEMRGHYADAMVAKRKGGAS